MDDTLYNILLGAAPSDPQKQAAVAQQLRRRRSFGELGALTGDRVLQPFGQAMSKQADSYADAIQDTRQKDTDNAQTKNFQTGQLKHLDASLAETKRENTMTHIYQMLMAQAALEKADKAGTTKPSKLTYADRNKLENTSNMITNANDLTNSFDDSYAQRLGPGPQSRLPNALSAIGVSSKDMDKSANWWSQWNLIYTLPQRNATFGATLTPTEKQSWTESDINPSMDPSTIRDRASKVLEILKRKGALMNKTYQKQYDPAIIQEYGLPDESELANTPQGAPAGHGAVPSGLTPEEQQELAILRAKHRGR